MVEKIPAFVESYMKNYSSRFPSQDLTGLQVKQGLIVTLSFLFLQLEKENVEKHNQLIYLLEHHTILESSAYQRIYLVMQTFVQAFDHEKPNGVKIDRVVGMPILFDGLNYQTPYRELPMSISSPSKVADLLSGGYRMVEGVVSAAHGLEVMVTLKKRMSDVVCRVRLAQINQHIEIVSFHLKEVEHEKK